ncbi:phosphotransferase [Phycisphaerales bacterium AB-hyl4]|uniref:Phosphotransferase n=1 Tax=Natronomicrosphaera hydrolytica TaxID=3242702 RepID=A0ABV4U3T1_9BACT
MTAYHSLTSTSTGKAIPSPDRSQERVLQSLLHRRYRSELPFRRGRVGEHRRELADLLYATARDMVRPNEVFARVRFGGLLLCVAANVQQAQHLARRFGPTTGFHLEQPPTPWATGPFGLHLPGLTDRGWFFAARKIHLIQPGEVSDRFTYHVQLVPDSAGGYFIEKKVPTHDEVFWRLTQKYPRVSRDDLARRTHKLVDHVFPTFLTRETAMLKILQRDLPPEFRSRVPRLLEMSKDEKGFVRRMSMNWLRLNGRGISQLDFALQASELLAVLHEKTRVMHLDLRPDNIVITDDGVGFVDFGSAVRMGEPLGRSQMLQGLFDMIMHTSQIQRMLGQMLERGQVTSEVIRDAYGKVDPGVDLFFLTLQMRRPHAMPELRAQITYEPNSPAARKLEAFAAAVLKPADPAAARYTTAGDLLTGVRRIARELQ